MLGIQLAPFPRVTTPLEAAFFLTDYTPEILLLMLQTVARVQKTQSCFWHIAIAACMSWVKK